jgi:DNA-binding response OmpR family regulator
MKILTVDDDVFIRELLPLIAAKAGFPDVTTVSSGQLAMETLTKVDTAFDCMLLDINMPGMNGIELCGRIRQMDAYGKTPIIMLTAMSERDYMDDAFKAGATDYATKPFDINELGARLRVAQELVLAHRATEASQASQAEPGLAVLRTHIFDLSDAIEIAGVKHIVDFNSLKNYLRQSSRAGLASSQLIAVKIDRIEELYRLASSEEFAYLLSEVAQAADDVMRKSGSLMSYAGAGIFVIVSNSPAPLSAAEIEADVQDLLDEKNAEYDSGTPMDLEVSIGNPIQPNFGDISDVPMSLKRAIARAEKRSATKADEPRPATIFLHRV